MLDYGDTMYGWTGNILKIDLTTGVHSVERPELEVYERYIGGKGMAGHYLRDFVTQRWDSPDMPLLFFAGPLTDTPVPSSGRMTVMSRSPLTGTVSDSSVGGSLGVQMKRAGWDGVIVTGRSESLCGIRIADSDVSVVDAQSMKGAEVSRTISAVHAAHAAHGAQDVAVAVIGPAAENGVLFSGIVVDGHHFAGRGGLGLVMAKKNLKYVSVQGSGRTAVYDRDEVKKARERIFRLASTSPVLMGEFGIANYGTGALYDLIHARRMMPTDNFRATQFSPAPTLNAYHYKERYQFKRTGCAGCSILCKKVGRNGEMMPEFETMSHFTALIKNSDMETVVEANRICGEAGMDTVSAGATLACYMEIAEKDLSPGEVTALLRDIAHARGVGAGLGLGSQRYARGKGREDAAITVKKQELPAYDPRGSYGMALAYATSTRGGCHLRAYPISHEILRKPVATDRFSFSGKARIIKISEDLNAIVDSLVACKFLFFAATLEEYAQAFSGVTGVQTTAQDLLGVGERIYYNECMMNAMNGFDGSDCDLPERFFAEPGTSGDGITVAPIDRDDFLRARSDYYRIRGLDQRGIPTREKCKELGIEWNDL